MFSAAARPNDFVDYSATLSSFSGDYHYDSDSDDSDDCSFCGEYERDECNSPPPPVDDGSALPLLSTAARTNATLAYLLCDLSPGVRRRYRAPATPPADDDEIAD